jgi:hypothetical protein
VREVREVPVVLAVWQVLPVPYLNIGSDTLLVSSTRNILL